MTPYGTRYLTAYYTTLQDMNATNEALLLQKVFALTTLGVSNHLNTCKKYPLFRTLIVYNKQGFC